MLNHVELLGRLAQEPEIRYTQSGTPVASFDLAVQVPSKNKDAAPDYIPIVCWRERAEFCGRYLSKGRQIVVEGRISTRKWKDEKTGQNRKAVEVVASNIYFADSNGGNANGNPQPANNDGFRMSRESEDQGLLFKDRIVKSSNHAGGTLGGISDGSDIVLRAAFKPTPSIAQRQHTVTRNGEEIDIEIKGRHDPIIVPRAVVVVEAMAALTAADLLLLSMTSRLDRIQEFFGR